MSLPGVPPLAPSDGQQHRKGNPTGRCRGLTPRKERAARYEGRRRECLSPVLPALQHQIARPADLSAFASLPRRALGDEGGQVRGGDPDRVGDPNVQEFPPVA